MEKPVLVIMAAGMGSRYGGLKQIDPIDGQGHIIIDFSLYDARRTGFEKVIFIIKRENEELFKECIGNRIARYMEVSYVFQELDSLPEGFAVPEGRVKPWGTGHAVLSCLHAIDGPFAVINADDYYGAQAFRLIYEYLTTHEDDTQYRYAMVGYVLKNTLTDNGHVARGVCQVDASGYLADIHERTHIVKTDEGAAYTEDDGHTWEALDADSLVSLNMWGFTASILKGLEEKFPEFLRENLEKNPLKCEYFLPFVVGELLAEGRATVQVLRTEDRWYGVTYQEDKDEVSKALQELKNRGVYPENLWEKMLD